MDATRWRLLSGYLVSHAVSAAKALDMTSTCMYALGTGSFTTRSSYRTGRSVRGRMRRLGRGGQPLVLAVAQVWPDLARDLGAPLVSAVDLDEEAALAT